MSEADPLIAAATPAADGHDGEAWNKGMYLHSVNGM